MKIKLINLKTILKTLSVILLLFMLTAFPQTAVKGAKSGLKTFGMCVLPSIFPFMVITKYIVYSNKTHKLFEIIGKFFNISATGAQSMLLGSISGYPSGAILIGDNVKKKD